MKVQRAISLKEKLKIIEDYKKGKKQVAIANELNIPASTVSTIVKSQEPIVKALDTQCFKTKRKRLRCSSWPNVEKALLLWIQNTRSQKISVSGPVIKEKAENLALLLDAKDFTACDGWLSRFKERHSLVFRTVCGDAASVDTDVTESWKKEELLPLIKEYDPKDIFNADETALFYKMQPNKTITLSTDDCIGGKKSKERITLMVCSNMTGTEKAPLMVIGKYKKPRSLRRIHTLPVDYENNTKSWATQVVFEKWLKKLD